MALEFRPASLQPRQTASQYAQQWSQGLQGIGDTVAQAAQQRQQQKRQAMLDQYLAAKEEREQQEFDSNYGTPIDPNAMIGQPTGQMGQSSFMPGGPQPVATGSPLIDVHKQWMAKGRPMAEARPEYMGAMGKEERKSYFDENSPLHLAEVDLKRAQANKAMREVFGGGDNPDYTPEDLTDAQSGNFKAIAARHGGVIPHSFGSLVENANARTDTAYEKKRTDAQNGMINVRGDQSIARTENQRDAAAMAYNTIERVKKEGRLPSKLEYYDLLGQMWKARTGAAPTDQALRDLDQKTLRGDIGKAYTFFSGKPAGATTQDILQNLQNFVAESGVQAEKQHEAYMSPRQSRILNGLRPDDQQRLMNTNRGLSFQDQTGYKPVPTINSQQEYNALPSGSDYIDSTGKRARKR